MKDGVGCLQRRPSRPAEHARATTGLSALRSSGRRITRQRSLIWDTLVETRQAHQTAAEIAAAVAGRGHDLHRATIYRTLDALVEEGLLLRTDLGLASSYYELATDHMHHHVVCDACGTVGHLHDNAVARLRSEIEAALGFQLAETELTLPGRCPSCAATG